MPNYNDLQELKEKIQSLGNEPEILKNKKIPLNDPPLPGETSKKIENAKKESAQVDVDTEDLMSDILDDFEQGKFVEDNESKKEDGVNIDTSDLDDLLGEADIESPLKEELTPVETMTSDDELDALLGGMGTPPDGNIEDKNNLEVLLGDEPSEEAPIGESQVNVDDLGDLLGEGPSELTVDEDKSTAIKADTSDLDDLLVGVDVGSAPKEEIIFEDTMPMPPVNDEEPTGDEELDALLGGGDFGTSPEMETPPDTGIDDVELGDLLGDMETPLDSGDEPVEEAPVGESQVNIDDLGDLLGEGPSELTVDEDESTAIKADTSDLDDLLAGVDVGSAPKEEITPEDTMSIPPVSDEEPIADDGLGDLLGDISAGPEDDMTAAPIGGDEFGDLLGDISAGAEDDMAAAPMSSDELGDLLGDIPGETDIGMEMPLDSGTEGGEEVPLDFEGDDILEQLGQEKEPLNEIQDLDSLLGEESSLPPIDQIADKGMDFEIPEELQKSDLGGEEEFGLDALQDISALESESIGMESPDLSQVESDDFGSFDLDKLDSFSEEELIGEESIVPQEEPGIMDASFGEIPLELSEDDIKKDQDIEVGLTDDERKQVVISLRNLPKDAEIKISKAIISNKYSNSKLKPLIDALIESESPQVIIKYYERITGDTSLSQIEAIKHAGVKFEERQKTFAYVFEKNIVPILSKIMAGIAVFVLIALFIGIVVWPRVRAAGIYKQGKVLIEQKKFNDAQGKFDEAFNIHPKYNQVIDYAHRYKKYKRYLAAEKMYDLAVSMRPENKKTILEFADMFRESKNFDRAESKYRGFLRGNEKDIDALLGLAKTYYDWSEEEESKLDEARETYLDVLDIDKDNKEAVFGNLMIYIKKNNYIEVMKHYSYIEGKFGKKVDPKVYAKLAEYLIDSEEVENVKDIIKKAKDSLKRGQVLPELEYQNARYNKLLNIYPEERASLLNVKDQIEDMKTKDPEKFGSVKYQKLLSRVYNDLGENYELSTKASTDAERYYSQAIITDPSYGKAYYNLANFALNNKPNGYEEAKEYYLDAEKNGFTNDRLNFNLGWLYYRERDYFNAYNRVVGIFDKEPDNSNLKFLIGTIFYRMGKYDLSESLLLEAYMHFEDLSAQYYPLDPNEKEGKMILEMIEKVGNNLGAVYQKKYEETRKSKYIISATKYYQDSIMAFDKLINRDDSAVDINMESPEKEPVQGEFTKFRKENAHINLRMALYPDAGMDEPIIYEEFPLDYSTYM